MLTSVIAGLLCGVLSGYGIGGGSLLMVYLTALICVEQKTAQTVNLLYFLPTAACALLFHAKNKLLDRKIILPAAICGSIFAAVGAMISARLDMTLLRKLFGGFLILVGLEEVFMKGLKKSEK